MPFLSERHRRELEASAIAPDLIAERGYFTATTPAEVPAAFADYQRRPGLVIPIRDVTGEVVTYQLKADEPRHDNRGKTRKYEFPAGARQVLDLPLRSLPLLGDPREPLWITEGAKKVDSALSNGIRCIIGVNGVYGWRGTNAHGGTAALPDWESIALNNGREVILAFDSDVMTKPSVRGALDRLSGFLRQRGATVCYLLLPDLGPEWEAA